ncbi:MAG: hypothetical protein NC254_11180 [bacterium]|nr:hypothetical protein [bacterium]
MRVRESGTPGRRSIPESRKLRRAGQKEHTGEPEAATSRAEGAYRRAGSCDEQGEKNHTGQQERDEYRL